MKLITFRKYKNQKFYQIDQSIIFDYFDNNKKLK